VQQQREEIQRYREIHQSLLQQLDSLRKKNDEQECQIMNYEENHKD
jgi:hypothetical protein